MYTPTHFALEDLSAAHAIIRQNSFATLVTSGPRGLEATHLPVVLDSSAGEVRFGPTSPALTSIGVRSVERRKR